MRRADKDVDQLHAIDRTRRVVAEPGDLKGADLVEEHAFPQQDEVQRQQCRSPIPVNERVENATSM
ncbi:hypothetical protein Ssi02_62980 [Sinosporangium siamense]|uniref:Uncharacterized protein n=1 Tax=Sinosporangium siamense TaxID=1367973 RepID=A0A919RLM0_9ACTN|nr:hypothetical protein Ssi02_62980 [Sinosporangium siamense]